VILRHQLDNVSGALKPPENLEHGFQGFDKRFLGGFVESYRPCSNQERQAALCPEFAELFELPGKVPRKTNVGYMCIPSRAKGFFCWIAQELFVVDGDIELVDHFRGWKLKAEKIIQTKWGQGRAPARGEADSAVINLCKLDKNVFGETVGVKNVTGKGGLTIAATWHAHPGSI
jgi:hypothetical protein